jgi:hypothetical protein
MTFMRPAMLVALKSSDYPTTGNWKKVIDYCRLLAISEGFNIAKYRVSKTIRKRVVAQPTPAIHFDATITTTSLPAAPSARPKRLLSDLSPASSN